MADLPYLIIECGPGEGQEIRITGDSLVLGRDSSSDYAIPNDKISRRHARIFLQEGRWLLEDLNSRNHTRLDNIKLEPGEKKILTDGDRIQLASQAILCFHDPATTFSDDSRVITDGLWLDTDKGDVYIHNNALEPKLSQQSFNILKLLYEKSLTKDPIASMEEIAAMGWPNKYGISDEMIDSEIYRLRKRLEELEPEYDFIQSERGRGRLFVQLGKK